jgi:photosystem II stability/assembly factor-like uncharacterized protein
MKKKTAWKMGCVIVGMAVAGAFANPALTLGTWVNISPPGVSFANGGNLTQGMTLDPSNPNSIYLTVCYNACNGSNKGIWHSTDGGSTWKRFSHLSVPIWNGATDLDSPNHIRVDPANPKHFYVSDGVCGSTQGLFITTDGGENFVMSPGLASVNTSTGYGVQDVYDVAVDPSDFNHVLISFHGSWKWGDGEIGNSSGILESTDGAMTWIVHKPLSSWSTGHAIHFLYDPAKGIGNSQTWLMGSQGNGYWRTTDAGKNWTQVSSNCISHGGGTIYYTQTGVLYASGYPSIIRSTNNGATWATAFGSSGYLSVIGDGTNLYTSYAGAGSFSKAPESTGSSWTTLNAQQFITGPFEMAFDAANGIVYAACQYDGLWAMKVALSTNSNSKLRAPAKAATIAGTMVRISSAGLFVKTNAGRAYDISGKNIRTR